MSIGNEVIFIDTVKYFQQILGSLASNLTENEKLVIGKECKKFIKKDENLARKFDLCSKEDQDGCWNTCQQVKVQFHIDDNWI